MVRALLRAGKLATLHMANASGVSRLVRDSQWRRRRLLILGYHGVSLADEHEWSDLYVSLGHLRRRLAYLLDEGYRVLPLASALRALQQGELPERSVALTFDDGGYDFLAVAYPLLREFGYPATLYLTTFYCGFQRPVFDTVVNYLLWKGRGAQIYLPQVFQEPFRVPQDEPSRLALHLELRHRAGALLGAEDKDGLARAVADQVGVDYDALCRDRLLHLMTPAEVASLDPGLVSVQLHTHRHRTPRNESLFLRELSDNAECIASMCSGGEPLEHFCYPSGDYDRRFLPWLETHGIRSATTSHPGIVTRHTHPLQLPRLIDTMHTPDVVLEGWLSGVAAFLPQWHGLPAATHPQ